MHLYFGSTFVRNWLFLCGFHCLCASSNFSFFVINLLGTGVMERIGKFFEFGGKLEVFFQSSVLS